MARSADYHLKRAELERERAKAATDAAAARAHAELAKLHENAVPLEMLMVNETAAAE